MVGDIVKHAIVPIQLLMKPHEKVVAECEAGIYVGWMLNGVISGQRHTLRLIRFDQIDIADDKIDRR